ncbi:MAG: restriction endonuclease [Alphaproteobacteria bacterium]|jgi:restriction system protein|nr:restriction endonuclease [Alphaproteobacteria bacterium]
MTIPKDSEFLKSILQVYSKKNIELKRKDIEEEVADLMGISPEDRRLMVRSGKESKFSNKIHWNTYFLFLAGLLSRRQNYFKITPNGLQVLQSNEEIDLKKYPSFIEATDRWKNTTNKSQKIEDSQSNLENPEEKIENAINEMNSVLHEELLSKLKEVEPKRFEAIVVVLMQKMGYGVGEATPYTKDGGIDGIINEDELGLSKIYLQAKRYKNINIGSPEVQQFVGAMASKSTKKGVFITTSDFTEAAKDVVEKTESLYNIILIGGSDLAKLMIKYNFGARRSRHYEVKEIDSSFFE